MEDAGDVGVVVSTYCDFELVAKSPLCGRIAGRRGSETLAASDEHLRKSTDMVTHSCQYVEVKKEDQEVKMENGQLIHWFQPKVSFCSLNYCRDRRCVAVCHPGGFRCRTFWIRNSDEN